MHQGSYEVESRIFTRFENKPENTIEARRRRRPLLRFARTNERLTGMPVLGILYPSCAKTRPLCSAESLSSVDCAF